jgi:hypothetical protein
MSINAPHRIAARWRFGVSPNSFGWAARGERWALGGTRHTGAHHAAALS